MASLVDFIIIAVAIWAIVGAVKRLAGSDQPQQIEDKSSKE